MKGKILIISDDPWLVKMLEIKLTQEDFITYSLPEGQEVLKKYHQINPDIVMLDMTMHHIDGFELYQNYRKDPGMAHIPFVFLSVKTSPSDQLESFRIGAADYICKPFEFEDLIAGLERIIQRFEGASLFNTRADLGGNLTKLKLADIIQIIEVNFKTGELVFKNPKGKQAGKAFFKNGNLMHAQMGSLKGEEAFYGLMGETEGFFEFFEIPVDVEKTIPISNMAILLNGSRLIDEASEISEYLGTNDLLSIKSREVSSTLETKIGPENIHYLFQLIEQGVPFQKILNSGMMSKLRAASALILLLKEHILEFDQCLHNPMIQMDQDLFSKIQETNMQKMSGVLEINKESSKASIHFHQGEIIHAECGMTSGKKALFRIFSQTPRNYHFSHENLSEIKSIQSPLNNLLIDAAKEMKGLRMINKKLFDSLISINWNRLNQNDNKDNREEIGQIIDLIKKHKKIKDILEASPDTDLKTFKTILELNNLNIIDIILTVQSSSSC
jgi:DNA-binding response OmpR family regulator